MAGNNISPGTSGVYRVSEAQNPMYMCRNNLVAGLRGDFLDAFSGHVAAILPRLPVDPARSGLPLPRWYVSQIYDFITISRRIMILLYWLVL